MCPIYMANIYWTGNKSKCDMSRSTFDMSHCHSHAVTDNSCKGGGNNNPNYYFIIIFYYCFPLFRFGLQFKSNIGSTYKYCFYRCLQEQAG